MSLTNLIQNDKDFPHEEYGLLLQISAPGTIRKMRANHCNSLNNYHNHNSTSNLDHDHHLKSKTNKSYYANNRLDLIMADDLYDTRPNGIVLPKLLRKKLLVTDMLTEKSDERNSSSKNDDETMKNKSLLDQMDTMEQMTLMERIEMHHNLQQNQNPMNSNNNNNPSPLPSSSSHLINTSKNDIYNNSTLQQIEKESENIELFYPKGYTIPPSFTQTTITDNIHNSSSSQQYIFTTNELEQKLSVAYNALIDIQKQLSRGEELYFQETDTHGNLYKNWDSIIDVKAEHVGIPNYDIGSGGGGNNGNNSSGNGNGVGIDPLEFVKINSNNNNMPNRRMNNDMRWFSLSSTVTTDQNILGVDGGGKNNSHRLGRKRSSRLSSSLSPFPSGRSSSRSIISDSDNNNGNNKGIINTNTGATRGSVSPLLVQSSETSIVNQSLANNNETESSKDDNNDVEMETIVKNEDEEGPVKQSVEIEEEHDDNDDSDQQNELNKKDPPTAEDEENQEQQEEDEKINKEPMKQNSDNDETNETKPAESEDESPTDDPSTVEGVSEENSENESQVSKKRKADVDTEFQDEDDTTPKKGRPRKRKK